MGVRRLTEAAYPALRGALLLAARGNGERVHEYAVALARATERCGLTDLLLAESMPSARIRFANAAGMNKDGVIPPKVLRALGFDVNIVGTVTHDPWPGNPERPRIWYFPPASLANYLGLPGIGSAAVARVLDGHAENGNDVLPMRISVMSTPKKQGMEILVDIAGTMRDLKKYASSWELNVSCPNTHDVETRAFKRSLYDVVALAADNADDRPLYIKLSPDMGHEDIRQALDVCAAFPIAGFTTTNTTLKRGENGIPPSQKGGASGDALYPYAREMQQFLISDIVSRYNDKLYTINTVGGINSAERLRERVGDGGGRVKEAQVFTGLTYQGPKLIRKLRESMAVRA